jgi:hypothetical protein
MIGSRSTKTHAFNSDTYIASLPSKLGWIGAGAVTLLGCTPEQLQNNRSFVAGILIPGLISIASGIVTAAILRYIEHLKGLKWFIPAAFIALLSGSLAWWYLSHSPTKTEPTISIPSESGAGLPPKSGGTKDPVNSPTETGSFTVVPRDTATEVHIVPNGQGGYTLEAHVTALGRGRGKLGGRVYFSINSQEFQPAPLEGDTARLNKVELERGVQRIAARFEPSPNYPGFIGSESRVLTFEVK